MPLFLHRSSLCRRTIPVICMLGVLAATGCASREATAERERAKAEAYLQAGQLGMARITIRKAIDSRDDIAANWLVLARICLTLNDVSGAYAAYKRVLELEVANAEALQLVAELALQLGRNREAVEAADQMLSLQPNSARAMLVKGFVALDEGRTAEASTLADAILKAAPSEDAGIILKARALARMDRMADAEAVLEARLATGSSEAILANMVEVRRRLNQGDKLAESLRSLVVRAPNPDRVFDLAAVTTKTGRVAEARTVVTDFLKAHPNDVAAHRRASDFWIENDPAIVDWPGFAAGAASAGAQFQMAAARTLMAVGRGADALKVIKKSAVAGATTEVRAVYALALYMTGDIKTAAAITDNVLAEDDDNGDALTLRARIRARGGDLRGAVGDAQIVVRDDPASVSARVLLAALYEQGGDARRARQFYEESLRAWPRSVGMASAYVTYLRAHGDLDRALAVTRDYVDVNPADVNGWRLLQGLCKDNACAVGAARGLTLAMTDFGRERRPGAPRRGIFGDL